MKKEIPTAEEIKEELLKKPNKKPLEYVSTGSTMLNLAISGNPNHGFAKGRYYRFVGDSASGKTFLSLTCLAEAAINPAFKDYRFIYDDVEGGAMMDIARFFGKSVAERLEPPALRKNEPVFSQTIEEFYFHIDDALNEKRPFIYVLDSMDGLDSKEDSEKFEAQKKAHRKGKDAAGSYGTGKAKVNSSYIRRVCARLRKNGSILIVISQTRDNLGFGFEKKTNAGGKALKFYACLEMWSSVAGHIKKNVKGKDRELGTFCQVRVKKNRVTGRDRTVVVPIYHSIGIDDLGSCVDYLVEEKHWAKKKGVGINAPELQIQGSRDKIIRHIEKKGLEKDVRAIVSDVWDEIESGCVIKRKPRYV